MATADQQLAAYYRQLAEQEAAAYEATRGRTGGEIVQDVGAQLLSGAVGLGQAAYGAGNIATLGTLDRLTDMSQNFAETQDILAGLRSAPTQRRRAEASAAFDRGVLPGVGAYLSSPALLQDLVVSNLPSLLPSVAAARYAGVATAAAGALPQEIARRATAASLRMGAAQAAGASNVDAINAIAAAGGSEDLQQAGGLGAAALVGAATPALARLTGAARLEALAANRLFGGVLPEGAGIGAVRGAVAGAGREGLEEGLQSSVEQVAQNLFAPGVDVLQGVAEAGALGSLAGGMIGTGLGAVSGGPRRPTTLRQQVEAAVAEAAAAAGVTDGRPLSARLDVPSMQVQEIGEEAIDLGAVPLPEQTEYERLLSDLQRVAAQPGALPTMQVDELPAGEDLSTLPLPEVEEGLPGFGVDEITSAGRGTTAFNLRSGLDLFGDPAELATLGRAAADAETPMPVQSLNQFELPFAIPTELQRRIEAATAAGGAGVQPLNAVEARVQTAAQFGLPAPAPLEGELLGPEARGAAPAGMTSDSTLFASPEGVVGRGFTRRQGMERLAPPRPAVDPNTMIVTPEGETAPAGAYVDAGGRDLFGAPLSAAQAAQAAPAAPESPRVPARQGSLGFGGVQASGWRQFLARDLGLRPAALSGRQWSRFAEAAVQAGVTPDSPEAPQFLQDMASELGADEATASAFGAALGEKYMPASPAQAAPESPAADRAVATSPEVGVLPTVATEPSDIGVDPEVDAEATAASQRILARAQQRAAAAPETAPLAVFDAMTDMLNESRSADEVAEQFGTMKDTPEFAALVEPQQQQLTELFDRLYQAYETPGRYYRAGAPAAGRGISQPLLQTVVDRVNNRRGDKKPVAVHATPADFTAATSTPAPSDVAGVFLDDGSIHLIASNIRDRSHVAEVLMHEQGHEGLNGLLGDRLSTVTNRLQANAALRTRIRAKVSSGLSRSLAAEEVLADMIAGNEQLTGDVRGKLRGAVRAGFDKFLGLSDITVTDAQVDRLLKDTVAYMRGRPIAGADGLRDDSRWLTLDKLLGDPAAIEGVPRFSRAMDHLAAVVDGSRDNVPTDFSVTARGAVSATRNATSSALSSARDNIQNLAMDMMPLNWIEEHYAKLFGGKTTGDNTLRKLVQDKSAKESDFNKTLTRESPVTYDGPNGAETFTTSPMALSKRWEALSRNDRSAFDNLNIIQQYATHYKVWPDRSWEQQNAVDYDAAGYTEQERQTAHARLQQLWTRVGNEPRQIFKESQAIYDNLWSRRFATLRTELIKTAGIATDEQGNVVAEDVDRYRELIGNRIDAAMQQLKAGPYSPLSRYGNYFVTVRDANNQTVWFSAYDSEAEAKAAEANLFNQLTPEQQAQYNTRVSVREDFQSATDGISHQLINQLESNAAELVPPGAAGDDAETEAFRRALRDTLVETYLAALPDHRFMQHANSRRGVEGFNQDAFRAFNDYSLKAARSIASVGYDGEISRDLLGMGQAIREAAAGQGVRANTVKMGQVLNAVRRQHAASVNLEHSPLADALSQGGFLMYMTSPSQLFINAMQTPMVAFPRLAGIYRTGPAMQAIREGMTRFFVGGKRDMLRADADIDPRIKQVLQNLHEDGDLDFTLAHDLTNLAEGDYSRMSARRRVMLEWASKAMHASEVFNRQVTAYATAKLELDRGNTDPAAITDAARRAIKTTQFDYSTANKARIMQGPFRRLVFQFQQYRLNMLAMLAKDIKESWNGTPEEKAVARRTLAWLMGTQLAFTGATGTVLSPIAFAIADAFRDDDDLLDSRTDFSRAMPEWLAHGLLSGVVDTGRLDSGSLLPILGDRAYAPKDARASEEAAYYLTRNIGPWAGLLSSALFEGPSKLMDGDFTGAVRAMAPKPIGDLVKTFNELDGAKTAQQVAYFDPGIWDSALGFVGLRSGDRRAAEELRGAGYQASKHAAVVRNRYLTQLALGSTMGDTQAVADTQAKIQAWNQSNPDMAIRAQDVRRAIRSRAATERNAEELGIITARRVGPTLLESLNLQR